MYTLPIITCETLKWYIMVFEGFVQHQDVIFFLLQLNIVFWTIIILSKTSKLNTFYSA